GHLGQKTGRGWYLYIDGKRQPNPEVDAMVRAHAAQKGLPQRVFSAEDIQAHIHAAMVNEGTKILSEGIAQRASDIDVVLVHGYGYPAWRGGPMHEADRIGISAVLENVRALAANAGRGFEPAALLQEMAKEGRRFGD
ncbi:MAG: 3-hydroxyacyl-CoA dehydrogenase family protein, partial [Bosea sp. (in: a-proteobacteria)]